MVGEGRGPEGGRGLKRWCFALLSVENICMLCVWSKWSGIAGKLSPRVSKVGAIVDSQSKFRRKLTFENFCQEYRPGASMSFVSCSMEFFLAKRRTVLVFPCYIVSFTIYV